MTKSKAEIEAEIQSLQAAHQAEMIKQNNLCSTIRSYAEADKIYSQICDLDRQLANMDRPKNW